MKSRKDLTAFAAQAFRLPKGKAEAHLWDAQAPGLALRIGTGNAKSWVMGARFAHGAQYTTRSLGRFEDLTLEQAREKARAWRQLIRQGTDPKVAELKAQAQRARQQATTFKAVANDYLDHTADHKKHREMERTFAIYIKKWGARPITDLAPIEVQEAIKEIIKRGSKGQARNELAMLRTFFSWATRGPQYGLVVSPAAPIRAGDLVGRQVARNRVLTDDEVRAVWAAAGKLGYPDGSLVKLLLLTGLRLNEAARLSKGEIDLAKAEVLIPAARMKGHRDHLVPLAPMALDLLRGLPEFAGAHVFTTTGGRLAINGFSVSKARIDKESGVTDWVFHDLRRTMRTGLSALPVEDRVREAMIAHKAPQLHVVYDRYEYREEKRRGFGLWEARLAGILAPKPPAEVADLREAQKARTAA